MKDFIVLTLDQINQLQDICKRLEGKPYKFGSEINILTVEPEQVKQLDCSELVEYVYRKIGYIVPDGSYNQYAVSGELPEHQLKDGDLLFRARRDDNLKSICHVGIVLFINNQPKVCEAVGGSIGKVVIRDINKFKVPSQNTLYIGSRRFYLDKIKEVIV